MDKIKIKSKNILLLLIVSILILVGGSFGQAQYCTSAGCQLANANSQGDTNFQLTQSYGNQVTGDLQLGSCGSPDGVCNALGEQVAGKGDFNANFQGGTSTFSNGQNTITTPKGIYPSSCGSGSCGISAGTGGSAGGSGGGGFSGLFGGGKGAGGGGGAGNAGGLLGGGQGGGGSGGGGINQISGLLQNLGPLFAQNQQKNDDDKNPSLGVTQSNGRTEYDLYRENLLLRAENDALLTTNRGSETGTISTALNSIRDTEQQNTNTIYSRDNIALARVETPADTPTSVVFDLSQLNAFGAKTTSSNQPSLSGINYPILQATPPILIPQTKKSTTAFASINTQAKITGKQIASLYSSVELIDHDLNFKGQGITVYALDKTFNEITAEGQDLTFVIGHDSIGHNKFVFKHQRTLMPRVLSKLPRGAGKIFNARDKDKNIIVAKHYTNTNIKGDIYLLDNNGEKRVTFSDLSVTHPKEQRLIVYNDRLSMWPQKA